MHENADKEPMHLKVQYRRYTDQKSKPNEGIILMVQINLKQGLKQPWPHVPASNLPVEIFPSVLP